MDAVRELLVNSLIHRDYQSPTDIQIRIYDNSITFFNPSGLYGNITEEELKTDSYQASTRNKQIAEAFYLTNDIECGGLEVGIILNLPIDPSTLLNRQEKARERYGNIDNPPVFELDQSDDSYLVLTGPGKQEHAHPWVHHVFRMNKPIPKKKMELLQQLFETDEAVLNVKL